MGQVDVFVVFLRFADLVMSVLQTASQVVMAGYACDCEAVLCQGAWVRGETNH